MTPLPDLLAEGRLLALETGCFRAPRVWSHGSHGKKTSPLTTFVTPQSNSKQGLSTNLSHSSADSGQCFTVTPANPQSGATQASPKPLSIAGPTFLAPV